MPEISEQPTTKRNGNGIDHKNYAHKKRYKIVTIVSSIICVISIIFSIYNYNKFYSKDKDIKFAFYIADEFERSNINVSPSVIYSIIKCTRPIINKYFNKREFGLNDVLAIGYVESCYRPETIGKAGEVGLFQILKPGESLNRLKKNKEYDFFDIELNVEMCIEILRQKYDHPKLGKSNYQETIMAYNGVGNKIYWSKFISIKKIIDRASFRLNNALEL